MWQRIPRSTWRSPLDSRRWRSKSLNGSWRHASSDTLPRLKTPLTSGCFRGLFCCFVTAAGWGQYRCAWCASICTFLQDACGLLQTLKCGGNRFPPQPPSAKWRFGSDLEGTTHTAGVNPAYPVASGICAFWSKRVIWSSGWGVLSRRRRHRSGGRRGTRRGPEPVYSTFRSSTRERPITGTWAPAR